MGCFLAQNRQRLLFTKNEVPSSHPNIQGSVCNTPTLLTHLAPVIQASWKFHKRATHSPPVFKLAVPSSWNSLPHLPQDPDQMSVKIDSVPQILPCTSSQAPPKMASPFCLFPSTRTESLSGLFWGPRTQPGEHSRCSVSAE